MNNVDKAPDHMSEVYFKSDTSPVYTLGVAEYVWAELDENDSLTGTFVSFDEECPDGYAVICLINGEVIYEDITWMDKEEYNAKC